MFLVLVAAGNALQGSTPTLHGDADAVAGFALNAAGALRAREGGSIPAGVAVVFYDGGLALSGLAAPVAMAALLAATSAAVLRHEAMPRWFGWVSAVLAALGLITPLSFILFLVFPLWVAAGGILIYRQSPSPVGADPRIAPTTS